MILEKWSGLLTHSLSFQDSGCSRGRERGLSRWGFINPLHKCTVIIAALLYVLYFEVSPWDFILDKRHFLPLQQKKGWEPLPSLNFIDKETEAQTGRVICPSSHSRQIAEPRLPVRCWLHYSVVLQITLYTSCTGSPGKIGHLHSEFWRCFAVK